MTAQTQQDTTDRGSVLPMVLVLTVVGSITVVALLNFAVVLFRVQPRLAERDDTFQTARSAMEMAIVLQREAGPSACYTTTQPSTIQLNDFTASVSCSPAGGYFGTARNRLGLITTSLDPTTALTGPSAGQVTGERFITGADPADARVWSDLVGDDPDNDGVHDFPTLPPVPAFVRGTVDPPRIGPCRLYFPGRYTGALVLDGGRHYFASGIYYFDDVVTITGGAQVVAGEGSMSGCAGGDALAAGAKSGPTNPSITGRGATFLFGGAGRLEIGDQSRFEMNLRVSDATTRGSDGIAIRTVNFGTIPPDPADPAATPLTTAAIPADVVFVADVFDGGNTSCDSTLSTVSCLQRVDVHQVQLPNGATATYAPSTLLPTDVVVRVDQTAGNAAQNTVVIDGTILTPNAAVVLDGGANADHQLEVTGGIIASSVILGHQSPSTNYFVGVLDQAVQRRFALVVQVAGPNVGARSEATIDVNSNGNYAINAWSVDVGN